MQRFSESNVNYPGTHACNLRKWRLLILLALVLLADWLFFGHQVGLSFALFLCAIGFVVWMMSGRSAGIASLWSLLAVIPSLQAVNPLSLLLGLTGLIAFVVSVNRCFYGDLVDRMWTGLSFAAQTPFRLVIDASRMFKQFKSGGSMGRQLAGWVVPIGFSLVFLWLFSEANPLISSWMGWLNVFHVASSPNWERIGFWGLAIGLCWPFLRVRAQQALRRFSPRSRPNRQSSVSIPANNLFSEQAVFRSLLSFNVLFALQNTLDATFLWGSVALPDGMTYATYAHRGAYTLILTALLAAGFVLFASRRGSASEHSSRIRFLLILWTAQNAVLVQYCVLRLNLYVEVYALTYWRIAAFIWMGMVFLGLVLIIAKFLLAKDTRWLLNANLLSLFCMLYMVGMANLPSIVASHNVSVSRTAMTRILDADYLISLGPAALPAIDRVLANQDRYTLENSRRSKAQAEFQLKKARARFERELQAASGDWRSWGWRRALVRRYLARQHSPQNYAPWLPEGL